MASVLDTVMYDLKEFYTVKYVEEAIFKDRPLFGLMPKDNRFEGKSLPIPIITGRPQGISQTFSAAQAAAATGTSGAEFFITQSLQYGISQIPNQVIQNTKSDMGSFFRYLTKTIDLNMDQFAYTVAWKMFGDGYSVLGVVSTITGTGPYTITLTNQIDSYKFAVNQQIVSSTAISGTAPTNLMTVTSVDYNSGVITVSLVSGTAPAANAYLFINGDYSTTLNSPAGLYGLGSWIPDSAPGSTPFFGVDRTTNPVALAGTRYNALGAPIEEAILDLVTAVASNGFGVPTHVVMNNYKLAELVKSLQSRRAYVQIDEKGKLTEGEVFFKSVLVQTPFGDVKVIHDRNCPINKFYALKLDDWTLYSNGGVPRVFDTDGFDMLRVYNQDAIEFRCFAFMQLACHNPGASGVGFFS